MNNAFKAIVLASWCCIGAAAHADADTDAQGDGKQVFDRWCSACHARGPRTPGTAALATKYNGQLPAALEERTDLTPEMVKFFVRHGVSIMPTFRKTEISDAELDALANYLSRR